MRALSKSSSSQMLRLHLMCSFSTWIELSNCSSLLTLFIPSTLSLLAFSLVSPLSCPVFHPRGHHTKDEISSVSNPCRIGRIC